jgi:hypothetical protein
MRATLIAGVLLCGGAMAPVHALGAIDHVQAMSIFEQAHVICARDNGALWGHTLCGPMLLVDGDDRSVVTNAPDADGLLKKDGEVWVGTLPPAQRFRGRDGASCCGRGRCGRTMSCAM